MQNFVLLFLCLLPTLPQIIVYSRQYRSREVNETYVVEKRHYPIVTVSVPYSSIYISLNIASFTQTTAIATGQVQTRRAGTIDRGWGKPGSIWIFKLNDGVTWSSLDASCQGFSCTTLIGNNNVEKSGQIVEPSNSEWYAAAYTWNSTVMTDTTQAAKRDGRHKFIPFVYVDFYNYAKKRLASNIDIMGVIKGGQPVDGILRPQYLRRAAV